MSTDYKSGGDVTRDLLTMRPEGNVGIGTNNPTQALHVTKTSSPIQIAFNNSSVDYGYLGTSNDEVFLTANYRADGGTSGNNARAGSFITAGSQVGSSSITFGTGSANNTTPTEKMRIDGNGNVGIGTTTPGSLLDIGSNVSFSGKRLRLLGYATTTGTDANLEIGDGGSVYWRMARNSSNSFQTDMSSTWGLAPTFRVEITDI